MNRPMNHAYSYDYVRALHDLADVLDNNPDLEPPVWVSLDKDEPAIQIKLAAYPAWLNAADTIGTEALTSRFGSHIASAAVRFGDSVFMLNTAAVAGMTRAEAEPLINWPSSSTAKAV